MLGFDAIAETALAEVPFLVPSTTVVVVPPAGGGKHKRRRPSGTHLRAYERVLYRRDEQGLRFPVSLLEKLATPSDVEIEAEPLPQALVRPEQPEIPSHFDPNALPALHALLDQTIPPLGPQPDVPPVEIANNLRGSVGPEQAPPLVPQPPAPTLNVPRHLGPAAGSLPSAEEVEQHDLADAMQVIKEMGGPTAQIMADVDDKEDAMAVLSQLGDRILDRNTKQGMALLTSAMEQMKQPVQTTIKFMRDAATGKITGAKFVQSRKP